MTCKYVTTACEKIFSYCSQTQSQTLATWAGPHTTVTQYSLWVFRLQDQAGNFTWIPNLMPYNSRRHTFQKLIFHIARSVTESIQRYSQTLGQSKLHYQPFRGVSQNFTSTNNLCDSVFHQTKDLPENMSLLHNERHINFNFDSGTLLSSLSSWICQLRNLVLFYH